MGDEALNPEQQAHLALFQEVIAGARDTSSSIQLLRSCDWDVERALQLHWAAGDEGLPPQTSASSGGLGAPLLQNGGTTSAGSGGGGNASGAGAGRTTPQGDSSLGGRGGLLGWLTRGLLAIGSTVLNVLRTVLLGGGSVPGGTFRQSLMDSYGGSTRDLQLPQFFQGSFAQALRTARTETKLLVVYLSSEHARYAQNFCTEVLANDLVRALLDENFIVWGGDIARMESHQVAQMIHARQYPYFCVMLPASGGEVRVLNALTGDAQADAAVALLTACLQEMETHSAEIVAHREQQAEDRSLREQQDREYEEALALDRKREEEKERQAQEQRAALQREEELRRLEEERLECRRKRAAEFPPEGPDATARLSMRLPAGQRVQRKFRPTALLSEVYAWADCCAYLPENVDRGLDVPARFCLKTSFPSRELTDMERTIQELELAGTNILLSQLEDDD